MKVLMVSHDEPVKELSRRLMDEGVDVTLFFRRQRTHTDLPHIAVDHPNPFYFTWLAYQIKKHSKDFDIVHAHHLKDYAFLAALSIDVMKPLVSTAYADDVFGPRYIPPLRAMFSSSRSESVILQTKSMNSRLGLSDYELIPHGIDSDYAPDLYRGEAKQRTGVSGFFVLYPRIGQGMKYLMKAAEKLKVTVALPEVMQDTKLDFDFPKAFFSNEDLPLFLRAADACVIPSTRGVHYLDAVRAMACGTPVIATESGLLPEVVGEAGIFVPICDSDAIADAISEVREDSKFAKRRITLGLIRSKDFHWDKIVSDLISVYHGVIG